jgi:hypothetical protein
MEIPIILSDSDEGGDGQPVPLQRKRNNDVAFPQQLARIDDDDDEPVSRRTRRKTRARSGSELPRRNLHDDSASDDEIDTPSMTKSKGGRSTKASNDYAILDASEEAAVPAGSPSHEDLVQLFSSLKPKDVHQWSKKTLEELAILTAWVASSGGQTTTAEKWRIANQLNKPFDSVSKWFQSNKHKFNPQLATSLKSPVSQPLQERPQLVTRRFDTRTTSSTSTLDKRHQFLLSMSYIHPLPRRVVLTPFTVDNDHLFDLNPSPTNILDSVYSQLTSDKENILRLVFDTLVSQRRVRKPMVAPLYTSSQAIYPTLEPEIQEIWGVLLDSEQAQRNLAGTPTDLVSPYGLFDAALLIMLHYPPDTMTESSMYNPTSSQSLFNLACKLGIEELSPESNVVQSGVLLFDVCPRKKPRKTYYYTRSHVPNHFRYIKDMWTKSTARIGIVMGGVSEEAFLDVFQRRIRCVAKVDYNNKNDRLVSMNRV